MFQTNRKRVASIIGTIGLSSLLVLGCDSQTDDVGNEIQDLKEARQNTQAEVQQLSRELEQAKQDVVRLEEKLALARRGLTDDVLQERSELTDALKDERSVVKEEVAEAQSAAKHHTKSSSEAEQLLQETQPPENVEAEVRSHSRVTPETERIRSGTEEERVVISKVRGVDQDATVVEDAGNPQPLDPVD